MLILTGRLDTVRHDMRAFAEKARASGAEVTHHEFAGADHALTRHQPAETARTAIRMVGDHLRTAYGTADR